MIEQFRVAQEICKANERVVLREDSNLSSPKAVAEADQYGNKTPETEPGGYERRENDQYGAYVAKKVEYIKYSRHN